MSSKLTMGVRKTSRPGAEIPISTDSGTTAAGPDLAVAFPMLVDRFIEVVDEDTSVSVPRSTATRSTIVSDWIATNWVRLVENLLNVCRSEVPDLCPRRDEDLRELLVSSHWPKVEPAVKAYALRKLATRWSARRYTDATVVMTPRAEPYGWSLPLQIFGRDIDMGQVAMDAEGNVIVELTTSVGEFRQSLRRVA